MEQENTISLEENNQIREEKIEVICNFCGQRIIIERNTKNCEICMSKYFLIENNFAILKVISQGGFGRIFKGKKLKKN